MEGKGAPTVVIDAGLGEGIEKLRPLQERIAKITSVCTYNRRGTDRARRALCRGTAAVRRRN
ncbi:MAG: hypothetical protein GY721_14025 [Deltaproteobacteria bacterium]|nr:hypothetical protein [Deltaproteobacteria bacterium]